MADNPVTLDFSKAQPIDDAAPQNGATLDFSKAQPLDNSQQEPQQATAEPSESFSQHLSNIQDNFIKGGEQTAAGISDLIHKIPVVGEKIIPSEGLAAMHKEADTGVGSNLDQFVGYGGETLMEFMMGDEALKALPLAKRLLYGSKIMEALEQSPRLMQALKEGAALGKVAAQLGPEEQAMLRKFPAIARRLAVSSAIAGTVQAGQTTIRSGGDVKEGLKQGAEMAAGSAVTGAAFEGMAKLLSKGGEVAGKAGKLSKAAEDAATKEQVAQDVAKKIDASEHTMHAKFESGENDLLDRLEGSSVDAKEANIASRAKELLSKPPVANPEEHEAVTAAKDAIGDRLDKPVKDLLEMVANGEKPVAKEAAEEGSGLVDEFGKSFADAAPETEPLKPWTANDLIDFRKTVRKLAESYPRGDINSRTLKQLMHSVDDTFGQVAEQVGDGTAGQDYKNLRAAYRDQVNLFDDPVIQKIRDGKMDDAAKDFVGRKNVNSGLPSSGKVRYNTEVLKGILGDKGLKEFGNQVFGTMLKDSTENGQFNPAKFVKTWQRITDESKDTLFDAKVANNGLAVLAKDAKSAAQLQHLTRAGVIAGVGAAGGGVAGHFAGHTFIGTMLGLFVGAHGGGIAKAKELLDYVSTHPATWGTYKGLSNAANSNTAAAAGQLARYGAGKLATTMRKNVFDGTENSLSGKE